MEWDEDDKESNENAESLSHATDKSETSKVNLRKSFIPHKKRVILQELESISENNILEDCSDYFSKSNNFNLKQRKINMNPQCTYKSADAAESESAHPETPPAALRQRIIEAREMREYLERELNELKDFTTAEKQMLAAEKGVEELQSSLDDMKNKLEISNSEKDLICKELEEIKRKYVDEQTEKQILETKWKHREEDLKKSLEEAWSLLRVKEDRITRMNEKISLLYSEREKVKDLNFTFGGQLLPSGDENKIKNIEQNICELFELSCHNFFENYNQEIDSQGKNELNEVNVLQKELAEYKVSVEVHKKQVDDLNKTLADKDLLISTYEKNLLELENYLSNDLIFMDKNNQTQQTSFEKIRSDIQFFLSKLNFNPEPKEYGDVSFMRPCYKSSGLNIEVKNEENKMVCQHSQTIMDYATVINNEEQLIELKNKIKEYEQIRPQNNQVYAENTTSENETASDQDIKEELASSNLNEMKLLSDVSTQTIETDLCFVNKSPGASELYFVKEIKEEEMIDGGIKECQKGIMMNYEEKDIMLNKIIKYEEEIKNNNDQLNILKTKLAEYENEILKPTFTENSSQTIYYEDEKNKEETNMLQSNVCYDGMISSKNEEINILHCKISEYEENIQHNKDELNKLKSSLSEYEESIKNKDKEISLLQSQVTEFEESIKSYEVKIKSKEEEICMLQSDVANHEELINSNKEEINSLLGKISGYEEKIQCNENVLNKLQGSFDGYTEKIKIKSEEISCLQNKLMGYEETVTNFNEKYKNKEEEIKTLNCKISEYEDKILCKDDELNKLISSTEGYEARISSLQNKVTEYEQTITNHEQRFKSKEEEINALICKISEYEEKIKFNDDELNKLQGSLEGHYENVKTKEEEINTLLSKISEYEEKIHCNKDEITKLQTSIEGFEEKMKSKDEEICMLQSKVTGFEETIKKIEEQYKSKEEEINILQSSVFSHDDIISSKNKEINVLLGKISEYEEKIHCNKDEITKLQTSIEGFEEKMKSKDEEICMLQSKVTGFEETIKKIEEQYKSKEEEINMLQSSVFSHDDIISSKNKEINVLLGKISEYEENIKIKDEEISLLQNKVIQCEESIKSYDQNSNSKEENINTLLSKISGYEDELNNLQNTIALYEEKILSKDEEINLLQSKVADYEENIKNYEDKSISKEEEIDKLLSKISEYEEQINYNEEELNKLQSSIEGFEKKIISKNEEISLLQSEVTVSEETIKKIEKQYKSKEEEISLLQSKVTEFEESIANHDQNSKSKVEEINSLLGKISGYEDELNKFQNTIALYEEKILSKDEEIILLQNKVTDYEETIANHDQNSKSKVEELNALLSKISGYEDELNNLQNTIALYEEKILIKDEEVNLLQNKVTDYEETIKNYEDKSISEEKEIDTLLSKISEYDEKIQCNKDEITKLQTTKEEFEEKIKSKDEEIYMLQGKVTVSEETVKKIEEQYKSKEEEISLLQSKVTEFEKIIENHDQNSKSKVEEINTLLSKILGYEDELNKFQSSLAAYEGKILSKDEEINSLQSKVTVSEEAVKKIEEQYKSKEEELNMLQSNVFSHDDIISRKKEEINILLCKISGYEEKIQCNEDELSTLQSSIALCKETIKGKDEEINLLLSKVTDYEETTKIYEDISKSKEEEISTLLSKISECEDKIQCNKDEIAKLQTSIVGFEEIIKSKDEEICFLQSKVTECEETIFNFNQNSKSKEEEINTLLSKISGYEEKMNKLQSSIEGFEEKIISKNEEISLLQGKVTESEEIIFNYDQNFKCKGEEIATLLSKVSGYEEEINKLQSSIAVYEEKIQCDEGKINKLQISIEAFEEKIKSKDEEINLLKSKVADYEETITNYEDKSKSKEEELSALDIDISRYKEEMKNKEEEIIMLQYEVSDYEFKIMESSKEINSLRKKVSFHELKIKEKEEELNIVGKSVLSLEEKVNRNMEEINMLLTKVSAYEDKVRNKEEEINTLQNDVSLYEEKSKLNEEEISLLRNTVVGHQETIKANLEEISVLLNKVSVYEEEVTNYKEEISALKIVVASCEENIEQKEKDVSMLEKNVITLEETIKCKIEEINILHSKVVGFEERIKHYEEEIMALQNEVSIYKDRIQNRETNEVNISKNKISKYEQAILEKLPLVHVVSENVKNVDGFNNTACSSISGNMTLPYSHNDTVDVEYDIQSSPDNTLNFTTLDSSSQLEQSVFISKLPQTDNSIKEDDPLASVRELSYTNEELETTLTEQLIKPCRFENLNILHKNDFMESNYANYNADENIKALIYLLNDRGEMTNADFDEILKQLLVVKEISKPKEDNVIYSFCQIIEHLINREFLNRKIWNDKMLLVKETLSNLQNIKDSFLKLKTSFSSLENITSQDYKTINSHFKNLFLCNRELSTENVLLKEQLKVSLLSEEKLASMNELLKSDLTNTLQIEKDFKMMEDELKEKCEKENDIILLIDKIANILNPNLSWPADQTIKKLEHIHSLLMESIYQVEIKDLHNIGFLHFFRNLVLENNVLKHQINPSIKVIKCDLSSLNADIIHQFKNLNADFHSISHKLSELYEKQEEESSANSILRDNISNLVQENMELKEELHNLKTLNNDLSSTAKDYGILMDKYEILNNIIQEKEGFLSDELKFKEQVYSFVDSLKDLYFMKDFQNLNNSISFDYKSNSIDFLAWLKTFLQEVHCIHETLLRNIKSQHHLNLNEAVEELVKEKNHMTDAYNSLNSEYHSIKQSLMVFPENIRNIKDTLSAISSEVLESKHSFIQDLLSINKNIETWLSSYNRKDVDYDNYKCNSEKSYNELNEKYLELLCSYENMETELKTSKNLIQEFIREKDELKKETAELDCKSKELRELISGYEMELSDYKNLCSDLEKKIIDVEREKGKIEEGFKQYVSLGEFNNLKADKNKLTEIIQNLNNLNCTLKESCRDLISCDIKNFEDDFVHLKNIIHSLLEVRNKYTTLELNYTQLISERNELLSKIESLNNLIEENAIMQKNMKNEIQVLIDKDNTHSSYSIRVMELLTLLDYEEPTKIDDVAWDFIEENINKYKSIANQNMESDKFELEEKVLYLESQLCDAQDFKSKFSKELHMLKPDLDISYLMSLSLADLQKTMIIAIIEKEKDVIEEYEMKLSLSTDKIQQLEEQQKRREDWLQEIEKENERLTNECKQIQSDNEILKDDINLKLRKIMELEHQITQQINGEQIKEYIKEREDSNHQLETAANERNTLQLSITSLNEKLQNKSRECEEVYNSLQKKAEVIYSLEKVLSKCKTENANLEKEVQHLRESMLLNLNNFNDNKDTLERDLVDYKLEIEKLHQLLSDTKKEIRTENKSVCTDTDEDNEIELNLKESLSNHLTKIESLNIKIDDLNSQLKQQNNKFDEEFKNQAKFIESLEKELNLANEVNSTLKNNLVSIQNQEKDGSQDLNLIKELQSEIISLKEINSLLENEKALLLKEKEVSEQSKMMHAEKVALIESLKEELESVKSKLSEEEDRNKTMQEQIDNLLLKSDSLSQELTSAQNTIEDLRKQNLDNKQLQEEITSLLSELGHCKLEISALIKEKEIKENQLSECFRNLDLEKEISRSVKSALEQTHQGLLNLKTENAQQIEKLYKDIQSKTDLCSKLNSDVCHLKEINVIQEKELLCLKNELREKVAYIEEISSNSHSEKSCPFMKEAEDIKAKHYDLNKQLEHERETFKLWKTNLEEDLHCKLLKISDLELKLKKETKCYKEALMSNSELNQKLQESLEKFRRLEEKIAIQRDVFIKEKSKSETDVQNKEKLLIELEEKLLSVKHKCEEFSKDICMFLEKLSVMMQIDVLDLSSAITFINNLIIEKQVLLKEFKNNQEKAENLEKELKDIQEKTVVFEEDLKQKQDLIRKLEEELRETREKAEQLEEECEELNNDIKYHENEIGNLYRNGKLQEEKWMKEKDELEKEIIKLKELKEKIASRDKVILSLQTKIENYDKSLISFNAEKKILESEKMELERRIVDLEKNLQSLKNQEISYLDGIKREMNHLKLELVNKNKAISKLEMRLQSDTLPFQKKAELAERKVEELTKELRLIKQSQSLNQMSSILTSPMAGLEMSSPSQKNKDKIIERLEQEIKQLVTEKSALKLLAQNRRVQINELKEQLGRKDVHSFQD